MTPAQWAGLTLAAVLAAGAVAFVKARGPATGQRLLADRSAALGMGWIVFVTLLALFAPALAPFRPSRQLDILGLANQGPSLQHLFGTDLLSRDIWSRLLYGARVSLSIGALAMLLAVTLGALVGAVAGYFAGPVDAILMRLVDVGLSVPRIFMVLVAIALTDRLGVGALVLLIGLTGWFGTSRLVRAEVLTLRRSTFVQAATAIGARPSRIVLRHLLPNAAAPLIVSAALGIGNVILLEAALSFLGAGVQPPDPSWGNMIADGRDQLLTAPLASIVPGLAIALVVMALNAVGDGLRKA